MLAWLARMAGSQDIISVELCWESNIRHDVHLQMSSRAVRSNIMYVEVNVMDEASDRARAGFKGHV